MKSHHQISSILIFVMLLFMIHSVFWWRCVFDLLDTFLFRYTFRRDLPLVLQALFFKDSLVDFFLKNSFGRDFSPKNGQDFSSKVFAGDNSFHFFW